MSVALRPLGLTPPFPRGVSAGNNAHKTILNPDFFQQG
jgi:hypothetical protein